MGESRDKNEVTDKYSLRWRVFHKLREDILSGKYSEHEELKEATTELMKNQTLANQNMARVRGVS